MFFSFLDCVNGVLWRQPVSSAVEKWWDTPHYGIVDAGVNVVDHRTDVNPRVQSPPGGTWLPLLFKLCAACAQCERKAFEFHGRPKGGKNRMLQHLRGCCSPESKNRISCPRLFRGRPRRSLGLVCSKCEGSPFILSVAMAASGAPCTLPAPDITSPPPAAVPR